MDKAPRVILETLASSILVITKDQPVLVAVNGKDASGKTIFSHQLAEYLAAVTNRPIIQVSFDGFLNEASIRNAPFESQGRGSYEHAFNYEGYLQNFLIPVSTTPSSYASAIYNLEKDEVLKPELTRADPNAIFIVDGLFLYRDELVKYWDYKILLQADEAVIVERGSKRDAAMFGGIENAKERYLNRYLPSQEIYYAEARPAERADVIIDNSRPAEAYLVS